MATIEEGANNLVFRPGGQTLAVVGRTDRVRLYNPDGSPNALPWIGPAYGGLTFSPDGARILTTDDFDRVRLWDVTPQ
ncbi:hypothetical protein [Plantactinospora sp. CA-290183]|uniref:hypothetical protein n=1 Tax=Plantactinospora sp. CA-290183 TaxID=3240006 RepID=UPI003D8EA79C